MFSSVTLALEEPKSRLYRVELVGSQSSYRAVTVAATVNRASSARLALKLLANMTRQIEIDLPKQDFAGRGLDCLQAI